MKRPVPKKQGIPCEKVLDFPPGGTEIKEWDFHEEKPIHPVRTCAVERRRKPDTQLLRFVLSPDLTVVPDLKRKLPGRGVWLTAEISIVKEALKRNAFQRAFKQKVKAGPDLPLQIETLMRKAVIESLSLANKAGLLITGFAKLEQAITKGGIIVLLHASEAAPDGVSKLDRKLAASFACKDHILPKICLTSAELSLAAGKLNVIHAGLKEGEAAQPVLKKIERLSFYIGQPEC